jgi:sulfatase modifying factor 1
MKKFYSYLFLLFAFIPTSPKAEGSAILPHQGRVLLHSEPFNGKGLFQFALISQDGSIRWNHQGEIGKPSSSISINVNHGFYQCKLGDVSIPGMEPLPEDLFAYDDPYSLRIWFSPDSITEPEQLGPDQPLPVAPYAIATKWTSADEFASRFSNELESKANANDTTSADLIARIVSIGSKAPEADIFNGLIPTSMLNNDITDRFDTIEKDIVSNNEKDLTQDNDILKNQEDIGAINALNDTQDQEIQQINDIIDTDLKLIDDNQDIEISLIQADLVTIKAKNINYDNGLIDISNNAKDISNNAKDISEQNLSIISTNSKNDDQDGEISLLQTHLDDINSSHSAHLSRLDNNISEIESIIPTIEQKISEVNSTLSNHLGLLDENVSQIDQRIITNKSDLDELSTSTSGRFEVLDLNITNLHTTQHTQQSSIEEINQTATSRFGHLDTNISSLDTRILLNSGNIAEANSSLSTRIEKLESNVTDLDVRTVTATMLDSIILDYLKPSITTHPSLPSTFGASLFQGQSVEIKVEAEGRHLSYQWHKNGNILAGEISSSLFIVEAAPDQHDGNYTVLISNDFGELNSSALQLAVSDLSAQSQGDSFYVESAANMELLWVEPGTFTMGSPSDEVGRDSDEDNISVTLTTGFYLGKYEVTQAEYAQILLDIHSSHPGINLPVETISWNSVTNIFLPVLNTLEQKNGRLPSGWQYALPTEAEWEYACRAGSSTAYSWGNDINSTLANYNAAIVNTTTVGSYSSNDWGFFDMHGNVAEWVQDSYSPYSNSVTDPLNTGTSDKIFRGGHFGSNPASTRSAFRGYIDSADTPLVNVGFRLALKKAP